MALSPTSERYMGFENTGRRPERNRSYHKVYHLVCEGELTEVEYIQNALRPNFESSVRFIVEKRAAPDIPALIESAKRALSGVDKPLPNKEEVWILVDQDTKSHSPVQFKKLAEWKRKSPEIRHIGLSCPNFEFWLWLHFEGTKFGDRDITPAKLNKYISNYSRRKKVPLGLIKREHLENAVKKHEGQAIPTAENYEQSKGSAVSLLVKALLELPQSQSR